MQKLLIVLAIQCCLPWAAYGIQKSIPINWPGNLDGFVVVINTVCVGNMLGLMRPRWRWMLTASALILCYWAIWLEVKLFEFQARTTFPISGFEFRWYYSKILLQLLTVNFVLGILLSRYLELLFVRESAIVSRSHPWQFNLRDMLYLTVLCAGLALTAAFRFQPTDILDNFLGLFEQGEAICLITALTIFYLLLWQTWRWRWVGLGLFYISVFLLSILSDYNGMGVSQQDQQILHFHIFLFGIVTVFLYRFAGLRIDLRRKKKATVTSQNAEAL